MPAKNSETLHKICALFQEFDCFNWKKKNLPHVEELLDYSCTSGSGSALLFLLQSTGRCR